MPRARHSVALLTILIVFQGCADHAPVHVRAFLQEGVPLPDVELTAIPFDPDRLLDSLGRATGSPRPSFPALAQQIREYRRREEPSASATEASANVAWLATRDSVTRMARDLGRQDRKASGYREAYARFRQLYGRYTARQAEREARLRSSASGDRELASAVTRASDSLRAWESVAHRDFPSAAGARVAEAGRPAQQAETDSLGNATLELANGDWWVMARVPDPDNPFQELRWSVPVRVAAGLGVGLPLMRSNGRSEWMH